MKPKSALRAFLLFVSIAAGSSAMGQTTYTWTQTAGGAQSWNTASNWDTDPVVPSPVSGDIVDFSTVDIAASPTLTLEADRTAELWKFGDTSGSTTWTVNAGNMISLAGTTPTIQVNNGTANLKCVIDGTLGLTKTNGGTLILEATNTFTGNTTISGGTLQIGSNNTTGSTLGNSGTYAGDISITAASSKLIFNTNTSQELSGIISGDGTLQKGGSGTLTLSGANTYTGKTTLAAPGAGGPTMSISSFNSVDIDDLDPLLPLASSSLGAPTTVANGTIDLGSGSNVRSCNLIYTGSGETTDRVMKVSFNSSSKHTITANTTGGGLLKFTSTFTINPSSGTTASGLTLTGSGDGEIAAGMTGTYPGFLTKAGGGTWTLGGTNNVKSVTATGGTLVVDGSLNSGTTIAASSGTLTVDGSIGFVSTTISGATVDGTGSLGFDIDGATSDLVTMTSGALTATGLTIAVNATGSGLTQSEYLLVDATGGGTFTGPFAGVTGATGYELNYDTPNQVKLVLSGGGSAYDTWATTTWSLAGADALIAADPDLDGKINALEFGTDDDPTSGAGNPKVVGKTGTVGGQQVYTLTLPVRGDGTTPAFTPGGPAVSATVDGIVYTIEGSSALSDFSTLTITEVTGGDATAIQAGIPAPNTGWTLRTFRLPGTVDSDPKGFLRLRVTTP